MLTYENYQVFAIQYSGLKEQGRGTGGGATDPNTLDFGSNSD